MISETVKNYREFGCNTLTLKEFVKLMTQKRLSHKNQWYTFTGSVEGKYVQVKSFETWNQVLNVDGIRHGGLDGLSVSGWKKELIDAITYSQSV